MSVNELIDFIFEKYYKRIWFSCYYSMKLLKKRFIVAYKQINWKNAWSSLCWQTLSIIYKKEKHKISKTIRNNYLSTKNFENLNIVDIKSVITEHPKTSQKLSKIEKAGSNSSLYSDTKKVKSF